MWAIIGVTAVVLLLLLLIYALDATLSRRSRNKALEQAGREYLALQREAAEQRHSYDLERARELNEKRAVIQRMRQMADQHRRQRRAS